MSITSIKESRNTAALKPIYASVSTHYEVVLQHAKNYSAETIVLLNQKFFGRRVETMVSSPRPQSRVFSKNLLGQLPDGTTQASGWRETVAC
jgi:hypothetical protein